LLIHVLSNQAPSWFYLKGHFYRANKGTLSRSYNTALGGGGLGDFPFILDVANGRKKTWADRWGLHNALVPFNPGPVT
jgi:galactarate dehydratase